MNTRHILVIFLSALVFTICCIPSAQARNIDIGGEIEWFQYKEPGIMKAEGLLGGAYATYDEIFTNHVALNIFLSCAGGFLHYDGKTMEGTPVEVDTPNILIHLRTLLGYEISCLRPFTGIGIRFLDDDLSYESDYGYERQTTYFYSPFGMEIRKTFGNNWTIKARGEYDIFWAGLNRNVDYPLSSGNTTIELNQDSGYGVQALCSLTHPISTSVKLVIETFFRYWDIDQSDSEFIYAQNNMIYEFFEPANRCAVYGLHAGIQW